MRRCGTGSAIRWTLVAAVLVLAAAVSFAATSPAGKLAISIGFSTPDLNGDAMGKWIQQKFNVNVTMVNTEGDKLKLLATSGDLPDVFEIDLGYAFFNQLKMDDLIRTIPEASIAKYPLVRKYVQNNEAVQAFRAAQPFPNPPPGLIDRNSQTITFRFGFFFEIGDGGGLKIFRYSN